MAGIFNWSLEGLKMLLNDGKFEYSDLSGLDIKNMYKESADLVYEFKNRYYKDVPIIMDKGKIIRSGNAVPSEEVHHTFLSFLKQDENEDRIAKFLDMRLYNGSGKTIKKDDLDNPVIKAVIIQRLGSRLADLGIKSRQLRNKRLGGERVNHYIGLRRDYGKAENCDKDSSEPLEDIIEE